MFEQVNSLIEECETNQEKLRVVQTALIFTDSFSFKERQKLDIWELFFITEIERAETKKEKRGNPNFKKEKTLEEKNFEYEFIERGLEILKGDPLKYLPRKAGAILSNELKRALLAEFEDKISESKAYRIFEDHSNWVWGEILKIKKELEVNTD